MKAALLIGQLACGGTEKQVALLAQGLRDRGHDVHVLVMYNGGHWQEFLREERIPVINFRFRRGSLFLPQNISAFSSLVKWLLRAQPDVLNGYLLRGNVIGAWAAWFARVPVFVSGQRALTTVTGFSQCISFPLIRLSNRVTRLIITNAESVARDVAFRQRVRPEKIAVVYNGLPSSAFEAIPPADIGGTAPVVLAIANLHRYKGHQYLLDAVARLWNRGLRCVLALAGEGPERTALESRAHRLGIDVRFLGCRTDVGALLARADLVVHPGLADGLCNAIMEAMAAGKPIVAPDAGGNRELLDGRGLLVPPRNAEAMANAVELLLGDRALAERLGRSAREWSRTRLSVDAMVEAHADIYIRLLQAAVTSRRPAQKSKRLAVFWQPPNDDR